MFRSMRCLQHRISLTPLRFLAPLVDSYYAPIFSTANRRKSASDTTTQSLTRQLCQQSREQQLREVIPLLAPVKWSKLSKREKREVRRQAKLEAKKLKMGGKKAHHGKKGGGGHSGGSRTPPPQEPEQPKVDIKAGFPGDMSAAKNRVREKQHTVQIGLQQFTVIDRNVAGMDDPIYRKHREVWENLPRGQARVFSTDSKNELGRLAGLRKFGYRTDTYGFMKECTSVIAIEKENGECAHIAAFSSKGEHFWFVGSKHVHLVQRVGVPKDLEAYESYQRFSYASRIAKLWNSMCRKKGEAWAMKTHGLLSFKRLTLCAEAIFSDSQHIVDYQAVNELRFFAVAEDNNIHEDGTLCMAPEKAEELFKANDLPFAQQSKRMPFPSKELDDFLDEVARRTNSEGVVCYGSNDQGQVRSNWKEKSYPYVMERVAREAIKKGTVGKILGAYLTRRLSEQPADLRKHFADWETNRMPWLIDFAGWLHYSGNFNAGDPWAMSTKWLTLQKSFRDTTDEVRAAAKEHAETIAKPPAQCTAQVIMMVGPPGAGKSTLARSIYTLLQQAGMSPHWLNQDESGGRPQYINNIKNATAKDSGITHMILDKVNLDPRNRNDYIELGIEPNITAIFGHPEGDDAFRRVCVDRIIGRGENHRTLRVKVSEDLRLAAKKGASVVADSQTTASTSTTGGSSAVGGAPEEHTAEIDAVVRLVNSMLESYVPPEDTLGTVQLNIEATIQENLAMVWKGMTELAINPPPPLASLDVEKALTINSEYETFLKDHARPRFAGISVVDPAALLDHVIAACPAGVVQSKKVNEAFHVTTKYFGGEVDPVFFVEAMRLNGQNISLKAKQIVYNNSAVAIEVVPTGEFVCVNKVPHITVAVAKDVPPVYSNELLRLAHQEEVDRSVGRVPLDLEIPAVFKIQN